MASMELATTVTNEKGLGIDDETTDTSARSGRSGSDWEDIYTNHSKAHGHVFGFSPSLQNTALTGVVEQCFKLKFALLHGYLTKWAYFSYWLLLILLEVIAAAHAHL